MSTHSSPTSGDLPTPPSSPSSSPTESPQFPYVAGATFLAKRHEPPSRSEMPWCGRQGIPPQVTYDAPQRDWCLAHPPAPGITHDEDVRSIEIAEGIRVGKDCGSQLVLTVDGFVAKIYDPFFYEWHDEDDLWKNDIAHLADKEYITEAAAYSQLRDTEFAGNVAPTFYGAWTVNIPVNNNGVETFREVRLILMEHISGVSMLQIDPASLAQHERDNIITKALEAKVDLHFAGVRHRDFEPRNIMLSLADPSQGYEWENFRLCVIDFAACDLSSDGRGPNPQYYNPLFYHVGQSWWSDWGWLPPRREAKDWMWKLWGDGGRNGKYVVVERDPNSARGEPKYFNIG